MVKNNHEKYEKKTSEESFPGTTINRKPLHSKQNGVGTETMGGDRNRVQRRPKCMYDEVPFQSRGSKVFCYNLDLSNWISFCGGNKDSHLRACIKFKTRVRFNV